MRILRNKRNVGNMFLVHTQKTTESSFCTNFDFIRLTFHNNSKEKVGNIFIVHFENAKIFD